MTSRLLRLGSIATALIALAACSNTEPEPLVCEPACDTHFECVDGACEPEAGFCTEQAHCEGDTPVCSAEGTCIALDPACADTTCDEGSHCEAIADGPSCVCDTQTLRNPATGQCEAPNAECDASSTPGAAYASVDMPHLDHYQLCGRDPVVFDTTLPIGPVQIRLADYKGNLDLALYSAAADPVADPEGGLYFVSTGNDPNEALEFYIPEERPYQFVVWPITDIHTKLTVEVVPECSTDTTCPGVYYSCVEGECVDSCVEDGHGGDESTAAPIDPAAPGSIEGTLCGYWETDVFRVPLAAGQPVALTVEHDSAIAPLAAVLFEGTIDWASTRVADTGTGKALQFTATNAGDYYLLVFSQNHRQNSYTLEIDGE